MDDSEELGQIDPSWKHTQRAPREVGRYCPVCKHYIVPGPCRICLARDQINKVSPLLGIPWLLSIRKCHDGYTIGIMRRYRKHSESDTLESFDTQKEAENCARRIIADPKAYHLQDAVYRNPEYLKHKEEAIRALAPPQEKPNAS